MRLFPTESLILLACIRPALSQLGFLFPKRVPGCHYLPLSTGTYIHFTSPNETSFQFSIYTAWTHYYPDALRSALAQSGFKLASLPPVAGAQKTDFCGWNTVGTVKVKGWNRGEVSFKDLTISAQPQLQVAVSHPHYAATSEKPSMRLLERAATIPDPIRLPDNSTLNYIHAILLANSPDGDIAILLLEINIPIICTIAILGLLVLISRYLQRYLEPSEDESSSSQDIELSSLNGQSLSEMSQDLLADPKKPGMARAKGDNALYIAQLKNGDSYKASSKVRGVRSSSVYSRSVDGSTLFGHWGQ